MPEGLAKPEDDRIKQTGNELRNLLAILCVLYVGLDKRILRGAMITIVCFCWGDWPFGEIYIKRLHSALRRHFPRAFDFQVITEVPDFPRNLKKMELYRPGNGLQGRVIAFDLDTIITGSLEGVANYDGPFAVVEDFWEPGLPGGGVLSFEVSEQLTKSLWEPLSADPVRAGKITQGGFERYWFRAQGLEVDFWQDFLPGQIIDAKPRDTLQIIDEIPDDTRMVHFHGRPRPHEVERSWLNEHWRSEVTA